MNTLEELSFENTYAALPEAFYERVKPTPFPNPHVVSVNPAAAELLDLHPDELPVLGSGKLDLKSIKSMAQQLAV